MIKTLALASAASLFTLTAHAAVAQDSTAVPAGPATSEAMGTDMPGPEAPVTAAPTATGTITSAVVANPQFSILASALTTAELTATLEGPGPFTVFAPTNDAFGLLSAATREQLMLPANKAVLARILSYHVVAGRVTAADLEQQIAAGGGTAQLQTVAGVPLTAQKEGNLIVLTGASNSRAYVTQGDVAQSNGVVHVVNGVLVPAS